MGCPGNVCGEDAYPVGCGRTLGFSLPGASHGVQGGCPELGFVPPGPALVPVARGAVTRVPWRQFHRWPNNVLGVASAGAGAQDDRCHVAGVFRGT